MAATLRTAPTAAPPATAASPVSSRRRSRPPPPPPSTTADGWEDDVVPILRKRLEAESAYLSHRLSTHLPPSTSPPPPPMKLAFPSPPPSSSADLPQQAAVAAGPTSNGNAKLAVSASKIPVSPLARARARSRLSGSGANRSSGSPSSRALQDVASGGGQTADLPLEFRAHTADADGFAGSTYAPHAGESGSSGDDGAAAAGAKRRAAGSPFGSAAVARQRARSTPFSPSSSSPGAGSAAAHGSSSGSRGPARTPSPAASRVPVVAHSAGVPPVGTNAPRAGGMKPSYLSPGTTPSLGGASDDSSSQTPVAAPNGTLLLGSSSTASLTPTATPMLSDTLPLAPPLGRTWSSTSTISTNSPLPSAPRTPSPSPPAHALPSNSSQQQQQHSASSADPSAVTHTAHLPPDRLLRDEVAPFQILSRDLRAVTADGRVELGRGDGFTERELVRQMPSVWRHSDVPLGDGNEGSPSSPTPSGGGYRNGLHSPGWDDVAALERERERAREEDERKRQARRQELLDIARNGWELDADFAPPDDGVAATFAFAAAAGLDREGGGEAALPKGLSESATTNDLAAVAARPTPPHPSNAAPHSTPHTSQPSPSPASLTAEEEARLRRREEGALRQRALSTGASTAAAAGRRAAGGPHAHAIRPATKAQSPPLPGTAGGAKGKVGAATLAARRASAGATAGKSSSSSAAAAASFAGAGGKARRASIQPISPVVAPSPFPKPALPNGDAKGSSFDNDAAETNSIQLSLYGEDAVPPMADAKPTKDELMNWDSVVIPAVRKKMKHNPLLEWDDSISNPPSTPPNKARSREPYTPPSAGAGTQSAVSPLRFGNGADGEGDEREDWPPPAPGTFGYKPPRSRTTTMGPDAAPLPSSSSTDAPPPPPPTTANDAPPQSNSAAAFATDPAYAGFASRVNAAAAAAAGADAVGEHDRPSGSEGGVGSPTPSSAYFEKGQRRMSKQRDPVHYHPQAANPVEQAAKQTEKVASSHREQSRRSRRQKREEEEDGREEEGVVKKGGCRGCVVM